MISWKKKPNASIDGSNKWLKKYFKVSVAICGVAVLVGGLGFNAEATVSKDTPERVEGSFKADLSQFKQIEKVSEVSSEVDNIVLHAKVKTTAAAKPRYVTIKTIKPRKGLSKGASLGSATAGYIVYGTGKTSKGHTQIKFFNHIGWVKSNQLKRVSAASYKTKRSTALRSSPGAGKTLATVLNDYTVGTFDNVRTKNGAWVKVQYKGKTGWVSLKHVKKVSVNAAEGAGAKSYSNSAYAKVIKSNVAKYCKNLRVDVTNKSGVYYAQSNPEKIVISRNSYHDPSSNAMKALSLHECAHIKTFKLYPRDFNKLEKYAQKINPNRDSRGIEHLTDCMSDLMGAKRNGVMPNGWSYSAGYGGKCSGTQKSVAKKLLQGKRV